MAELIPGFVRNHLTFTALTATITPLIAGIAWTIKNRGHLAQGANTFIAVKDCVLDNKIKSQRDNCFNSIRYLQDNLENLSNLNFSDYHKTKNAFTLVVKDVNQRDSTFQWLEDLNQRTQKIWNNFDKKTQEEMKKRGIMPSTLSLDNIPKSAVDMALWIEGAGDYNARFQKCQNEMSKCLTDKDEAIKDSTKCRDDIINEKKEINSLMERKGECKILETIKEKNEKCFTEKDICKEEKNVLNTDKKLLEKERDSWKEKYESLKNEYNESQKWFFRRWSGL